MCHQYFVLAKERRGTYRPGDTLRAAECIEFLMFFCNFIVCISYDTLRMTLFFILTALYIIAIYFLVKRKLHAALHKIHKK